MFAGKKSAQIREILISESAWEEMTCLFAPSLGVSLLCVDSHEMINIIKTVMDAGLSYTTLRDQIFTHPSMSESLNDLFSLIK